MKTIEKIAFALIALVLIIAMIIVILSKKTKLYPQTTTVINIKDNTVIVEDFNGFHYQFNGAEDWQVGDICSCIMNDNGTPQIKDDKIVKVKYSGYYTE